MSYYPEWTNFNIYSRGVHHIIIKTFNDSNGINAHLRECIFKKKTRNMFEIRIMHSHSENCI